MSNPRVLSGVVITVAVITLSYCGDPGPARGPGALEPIDANLLLSESQIALTDSASAASILNAAITRFLTNPDEPNRESAVAAWHTAHDAWLNSWASAALISGSLMPSIAFQVDAWPVTPGFIDTLPSYPQSGIVADIALTLNADSLRAQHGFTDNGEVALGFHAIEFLLTTRPITDFTSRTELTARRKTLLRLQSEQLFADLQTLAATPPPNATDAGPILDAAISALSAALRTVTIEDAEWRARTRRDRLREALLIAAPATHWLQDDVLRRWLQATHPQATDNLFKTLKMLDEGDAPAADAGDVMAPSQEDVESNPQPEVHSPKVPANRVELALKAAVQILNEVSKAAYARERS